MNSEASYKLSETQIRRLIEFTHQKYVQYDDVKIEIVDHLASDIEAQMAKDRELRFEQALKNIYHKFPITGFAQFIELRELALHKIWGKKINKVIGSYFKPPKLFLTALIFMCTFFLTQWNPFHFKHIDLWFCLITYIPLSILYIYAFAAKKFPSNIFSKKPVNLLFLKIYQGYIRGYLICPVFLGAYFFLLNLNTIGVAIYSALYAVLFVIIYAVFNGDFKKEIIYEIENRYQHLNLDLSQLVAS